MADHPGWPVTLSVGPVVLRPPQRRDAKQWSEVRLRNARWLQPWEPSAPSSWALRNSPASWRVVYSNLKQNGRAGSALPFVVEYGNRLVGQVNVSNVVRGALRSANIGYWIDAAVAGRGITPTAVAMVIDHCFAHAGLHRLEIDIRPENAASLRVVAKLGLRQEGYYQRFLDIDGGWRDHLAFAVTADETAGTSLLGRLASLATPPG
jgi:ribosomal-protein-alanine N-acetyltransferase